MLKQSLIGGGNRLNPNLGGVGGQFQTAGGGVGVNNTFCMMRIKLKNKTYFTQDDFACYRYDFDTGINGIMIFPRYTGILNCFSNAPSRVASFRAVFER